MTNEATAEDLDGTLHDSKIVVFLGAGGVGKTTIAAATAIALAEEGRRVCVATFDPAKRLASALGVDHLANDPHEVSGLGVVGSGKLYACMLDASKTFDEMILKYAKSQSQAEEILSNRIYKNLTTSLSGTQEYMAMERLWELHEDERFDVVVIDTPPSVGALDFISAPVRLVSFLDNRVFQLIIKPAPLYLRPLSIATKTLLRAISKVVGAEVVSDAMDFFQAFAGIEEGFKGRASQVQEILHSEQTSFLLVTSARKAALKESAEMARRLNDSGLRPRVTVVNRLTPDFSSSVSATKETTSVGTIEELTYLSQNLDTLLRMRRSELANLQEAYSSNSALPLLLIDTLPSEITSVEALSAIGSQVLSSQLLQPSFLSAE